MARHRDQLFGSGEPVHEVLAELPPTDDLGNPQTLLSDPGRQPRRRQEDRADRGRGLQGHHLHQGGHRRPAQGGVDTSEPAPWRILPETDSRRGEAAAGRRRRAWWPARRSAPTPPRRAATVKDVFFPGGKPGANPRRSRASARPSRRCGTGSRPVFQPKNPPLYAAVTVQQNTHQSVALVSGAAGAGQPRRRHGHGAPAAQPGVSAPAVGPVHDLLRDPSRC